MTPLLQIAAFALGVCLSIRMIAALYAVIDLWYTIGKTYPGVLRGVLGWGAAIFASACCWSSRIGWRWRGACRAFSSST